MFSGTLHDQTLNMGIYSHQLWWLHSFDPAKQEEEEEESEGEEPTEWLCGNLEDLVTSWKQPFVIVDVVLLP